jgi:heme o synthase
VRRANIPMMSVVKGTRRTKIEMMTYTLLLVPVTLAPWFFGYADATYAVTAGALGAIFILAAWRTLRSEDLKHARIMFGYSVFYLFALFLTVMILS